MIKNFILRTFIVRKIHYERKLALFLKKSDLSKLSCFLHKLIGFIKIMCFPAILALSRPYTFISMSLLKCEPSPTILMIRINKGGICGRNHTHFSLQMSFVNFITNLCFTASLSCEFSNTGKCVRMRNS